MWGRLILRAPDGEVRPLLGPAPTDVNGHLNSESSSNDRDGPSHLGKVCFESIAEEGEPDEAVVLSIVPVRGLPRDVAAIEQLINAVGNGPGTISLDIGADEGRRFPLVRCRRRHADLVQAQLTSLYGSPMFEQLEPKNDPAAHMEASGELVATASMALEEGPHLPLLTWRELEENDPVLTLMGAAGAVREGEIAVSQVLIHGRAPEGWARPYLRELLRLRRPLIYARRQLQARVRRRWVRCPPRSGVPWQSELN